MDLEKILLKVLNDKASAEEYAALERWKSESEENIRLLQELESINDTVEYKNYDNQAAWRKVEQRIDNTTSSGTNSDSRSRPIWAYILIALGLVGSLVYFSTRTTAEKSPTHFASENSTYQLALEDETQVWLREGGTQLEVLSDFEEERVVSIQGEAYFDVKHDTGKPFKIMLGEEDFIKVVGTSFNLKSSDGEFDVSLYSGHIELHVLDNVLELSKGDRAVSVDGDVVKLRHKDPNGLSWKENVLLFDNTPLNQVFDAVASHFKTEIDYTRLDDISSCLVRERFTGQEFSSVMEELSRIMNFTYENNKELGIIITSLKCQ